MSETLRKSLRFQLGVCYDIYELKTEGLLRLVGNTQINLRDYYTQLRLVWVFFMLKNR